MPKSIAILTSATLVATILVAFDVAIPEDAASAAANATPPSLITLTVDHPTLVAGQNATLTATTDINVQSSASSITILDQTTDSVLKVCTTGRKCVVTTAFSTGNAHSFVATVNALSSGSVTVTRQEWEVTLTAAASTVAAGATTKLTATANQNVGNTGGNYRVYVFDVTSGDLLGTCDTGKSCATYTVPIYSGGAHSYRAVVAASVGAGTQDVQAESSSVSVARKPWSVTLTANRTEITAGQTVTLTARADQNVGSTGGAYEIHLFDTTTGERVQTCSTGKVCSIARSFVTGDAHEFVAVVAAAGTPGSVASALDVQATSATVDVARAPWTIVLSKVTGQLGANQDARLKILTNQSLTKTDGSYVVYWFNYFTGQRLGVCPTGTGCTVIALKDGSGQPGVYVAAVAAPTNPATLSDAQDVQAVSNTVAANGYWSLTIESSAPDFAAGASSDVTVTANHDLDSTGGALSTYLFDLTTGTLVGGCDSGTTCTIPVSFLSGPAHTYRAVIAASTTPANYASATNVQAGSADLPIARTAWTAALTADKSEFSAGEVVTFTATANQNVGATEGAYRLYVIDTTDGTLVGSCDSGATCEVPSSSLFGSGGPHSYAAVVAASGASSLATLADVQATSDAIALARAAWTISLSASTTSFAAGNSVTFTATANQNVANTDDAYQILILDETTGTQVAACMDGSTCEQTIPAPFTSGGPHSYVAVVAARYDASNFGSVVDIQATSVPISVERKPWTLTLTATAREVSQDLDPIVTTTLTVEANQFVAATGGVYAIVLLDRTTGEQTAVFECGLTCTFPVSQPNSATPHEYIAYVAQYNEASSPKYFDVQAESNGISADTGGGTLVPVPLPVPAVLFGNDSGWDGENPIIFWLDPELGIRSADPVDPETGEVLTPDALRAYTYDVELRVKDASALLASTNTPGTRHSAADGLEVTTGAWQIADGLLEDGGVYEVRARTMWPHALPDPQGVGEWSDWTTFSVVVGPRVPVDLAPAQGAVIHDPRPLFTALEPDYDASPEISGVFRLLDNATGVELYSEWSAPALEDGTLSWQPSEDLPAGTYAWQVMATDDVSHSKWSPLQSFTITLPPAAPEWLSVSAYRNYIVVQWPDPFTAEDTPVIDYTVTLSPGDRTVTVPFGSNTVEFDALAPGDYTVSIVARNAVGTSSPVVEAASTFTQRSLAPENLRAELDGNSATLLWDAPTDTGGLPITGYRVHVSGPTSSNTIETTETSVLLEDLEFSGYYYVGVAAVNARGEGVMAWVAVCPFTVPVAPTGVVVRRGDESIDVKWNALPYDQCSSVTKYTVTATPGGRTSEIEPSTTPLSGLTFDGLENGVEYTFTVTASNPAGEGPASEPSAPLAPASGATDTDGDGLADNIEESAGSDPVLADSDNDGLNDFVEVMQLGGVLSLTSSDTDGDGIGDAEEDIDEDGMGNLAEIEASRNPLAADTDKDGIKDGAEAAYGSDPLVPDTDGDGLDDGAEVRLELDPTLTDTDGDGESDQVARTTTVIEEGTSSVELEGEADVVVDATLEAIQLTDVPGLLTEGISISVPEEAETEETTFSLASVEATPVFGGPPTSSYVQLKLSDNAIIDELDSLAPVIWNDATGTWEFVNNNVSVSTATRTVRIYSPSIGVVYAVVDLRAWRANARQCDLARSGQAPIDLELVFDATPSMREVDPTGERFRATLAVLNTLRPGDSVAYRQFGVYGIDFGTGASPWPYTNGSSVLHVDLFNPPPRPGRSIAFAKSEVIALSQVPEYDWDDGFDESWGNYGNFGEYALGGDYVQAADTFNEYQNGASTKCRQRAMLLVTDGGPKPFDHAGPNDHFTWTPFLERTDVPVHVLDVGLGGNNSEWLVDVAQRTGGTYSYVPTMTDLATWVRDVTPSPPIDPALDNVDSDNDGLSDWVETHGVTAATNRKRADGTTLGNLLGAQFGTKLFYSDPLDGDSDDDGVPDGVEVGKPLTPAQLGGWTSGDPITAYNVISDPERSDGDYDGYPDTEEVELHLNALNIDTDGDLLIDGREAMWGSNPWYADTDHDGYLDLNDTLDERDPLFVDELPDPYEWIHDIFIGFICGDNSACFIDSLPWVIGELGASLLYFGDVRDFIIQGFFDGDWPKAAITAGLFVVSLFGPGIAAKLLVKLAILIAKLAPRVVAQVLRMMKGISQSVDALKIALKGALPTLTQLLEQAGVSAATIVRLTTNRPGVLDNLTSALRSSNRLPEPHYTSLTPHFESRWEDGEQFVRFTLGHPYSVFYRKHPLLRDPNLPARGDNVIRYPDYLEEFDEGLPLAHEIKTGYVSKVGDVEEQIAADLHAIATGQIRGVIWHFVASDAADCIGPNAAVLKLLEDNNIKFIIHLPK